jgi:predicted nuclease of predicted toxin-antitoxin system
MKLLFDQNLSPRLVVQLSDQYPNSTHVLTQALDCASDEVVWAFAKDQGYILVTKDSDFQELSMLQGAPPKVVWIRRGNCSTQQIEAMLLRHLSEITYLVESSENNVLLLY